MPEIYLIKRPDGNLEPSLPEDRELLDHWGQGEILCASVRKPRNGRFHRLFFAMLHVVLENQDRYDNVEQLLLEVKVRTGYFDEFITADGEIVYIPKSISFAAMDEIAFRRFYQRAVSVIVEHILPGLDEEQLRRAVLSLTGFWA